MSVYKLSDVVTFDSTSLTLTMNGDDMQKITITHSSSRCLVALLEAKGEVVSREELLQAGWGYAGLVVTSNSLSQAMTLLRKSLKQIGLDNVFIVPVSKMGYRISLFVDSADSLGQDLTDETVNFDESQSEKKITLKKTHTIAIILLALVISIFIITLLYHFMFYIKASKVSYIYYPQSEINNKVFLQPSVISRGEYLSSALSMLRNDNSLKIKKESYIYINNSIRKDLFVYFVCEGAIEEKPETCYSYFITTVT